MGNITSQLIPLRAARNGLRTYWKTAVLVVIICIAGTAAAGPVLQLASRLRFNSVSASGLDFHWSVNAASAASTQAEALSLLVQLLVISAGTTLALTSLGILSVSAARASARSSDVAVRRAVGASRRQLLGAALAEGFALGGANIVAGGLLALLVLVLAIRTWPGSLDPNASSWLVVPAALAVLLLVGSTFQLFTAARRRIEESHPQPLQLYIPAIQMSVGLTVLVASSLLTRHASTSFTSHAPDRRDGLVYQIALEEGSPARRSAQIGSLLARLKASDRVESASLTSPGALLGMGMVDVVTTNCGQCSDGGIFNPFHPVFVVHHFVSPDSFRALGVAPVEGRLLTESDRGGSGPVVVISEGLARRHFQGGQALGRQIMLRLDEPRWYTVVGVVRDRERAGFGAEMEPRATVYLSVLQHPPSKLELLLRFPSPTVAAESLVQDALGPAAITGRPRLESDILKAEARPLAWFGGGFALEGWTTLLVTLAGAFVLMRLWVRSLHHEIGIRRALGARHSQVLWYVLSRAGLTGLAGVAIALWFGPALWDTLPEFVSGLPAWRLADVLPYALVLVGVGLAGAMLPAIEAARTAPASLIGTFDE